MPRIRPADTTCDTDACLAIYAPFVRDTAVSFETDVPTREEFAGRIAQLSSTHAFLVAEDADGVAGYAYGGPHRARGAYRWTCETSVYLAEHARGHGTGRALLDALLLALADRGMWVALAGITLPNPASVALHEACGYLPVGDYRRIGFKAGAWRDVGWWQRTLRPGDEPPGTV